MKLVRIHITVILLLLAGVRLMAQDVQLSQYYNVPGYLNPSMVGMGAEYDKLVAHSRFQWTGLQGGNFTNYLGLEKFWTDKNSGAGFLISHDNQGQSSLRTIDLQAQYSYSVYINDHERLSLGLSAGLIHRKTGSDFVFPDQYTSTGYTNNTSSDDLANQAIVYPDFGGGAIFYSKHLWVGMSAFHLSRPDQSFTDINDRLPSRIDIHLGYKIDLSETKFNKLHTHKMDRSIYPIFNYKMQGKSDQVKIGLYGKYDVIIAGLMYRGLPFKKYQPDLQNNESVIILAGFSHNHIHVTYSYDAVVSRLSGNAGGAHELNVTIVPLMAKKAYGKPKPMKTLPCPAPMHH